MNYSIGEFAIKTGFSTHTLRYYEKEKLLAPQRLENGHRCYNDQDMGWIECIIYLKETGMPLKQIQQFALLRAQGESTYETRMELLKQHNQFVQAQIKNWQFHQQKLNDKIKYYQNAIAKYTEQ